MVITVSATVIHFMVQILLKYIAHVNALILKKITSEKIV